MTNEQIMRDDRSEEIRKRNMAICENHFGRELSIGEEWIFIQGMRAGMDVSQVSFEKVLNEVCG